MERQNPRNKGEEVIFKGTLVGKPPHDYRIDYKDDLTVSGRKKPIDFNTLGQRVEMNYKNLLMRLGNLLFLIIYFICSRI